MAPTSCTLRRRAVWVVPEAAASYMLPLIIGYQRAAEVLYTGEWIDAQRAVALGLASRICARAQLLPALLEVAAKIAAGPPGSMRPLDAGPIRWRPRAPARTPASSNGSARQRTWKPSWRFSARSARRISRSSPAERRRPQIQRPPHRRVDLMRRSSPRRIRWSSERRVALTSDVDGRELTGPPDTPRRTPPHEINPPVWRAFNLR